MRKLFITGGAGFIGSAFIRHALSAMPSCEIINFDALTYAGNLDNLEGLDGARHRFVQGNVASREEVFGALEEGTEAVINFAAETHVDRSLASTDEFIRTNVLGTQVLLDAARARGVRRFIQVSTDEVMGSLPDERAAPFTEAAPVAPSNPYAASKAAAEHLVQAAHRTFGLDTVITRSGNNYGPRQFPEKFISLLITNALENRPVPLYGDGRQVRDWIYVDDNCRAMLELLEKGRAGEVYNIGARNERRNLDVARAVLEALGKPHSLIHFVTDRPGHDLRYALNPSKLERETAWRPVESWESGLAKTIRWYRENRRWVERVRSKEYLEYFERQYGMQIG